MQFLVFYLTAILLPGALVARCAGSVDLRMTIAPALSFALLVIVLLVARAVGADTSTFGVLVASAYAVLIGALLVRRYMGVGRSRRKRYRFERVHVVPIVTLCSVVGYSVWAGPYTEVPADAWWHLGRINERLLEISAGNIGALGSLEAIFSKDAGYWYTIAAWFVYLLSADLESVLGNLALANSVIICIAIYGFALFLFRRLQVGREYSHLIAAASVLFFVAQFGISVFSYMRYYVYAPAFLNYVVYLGAIGCFIEFLEVEKRAYLYLTTTVVLGLIAAMVHLQEALFIGVMAGSIALVEAFRTVKNDADATIWNPDTQRSFAKGRALAVLAIGLIGYVCIHVFAYTSMARSNPLAHGVLADIRHYVPFLQNLYILKPTYQFYQVLTVWGVVVYALFVSQSKRLAPVSYFAAGMIIPLLTVFNPVFTDLFLRFTSPEVLWRMSYTLPLPFLGGYFLVRGLRETVGGAGYIRRLTGMLSVAALLACLFPIKTTFFVNPYSKGATLTPVQQGNDYRLWGDLLDFLRTRDPGGIITDTVTGYVIDGLTGHEYRGYKFYEVYASHIDLESYDDPEFSSVDGWKKLVKNSGFETDMQWLVVINQRDGENSATGKYGKHWDEDVMHVSDQYSNSFITYIESHPRLYQEIWRSDQIVVYKILTG